MARFVCYVFYKPDWTPYYVGAGKSERLEAGWKRWNNPEVNRIYAEIRASGLKPRKSIEFFKTRKEACARELFYIKKWRRSVDGGLLANLRIGDRGGVQGREISAEQRLKMRMPRISTWTSKRRRQMSERMKGNTLRKKAA